MITILPEQSILDTVMEGTNYSLTFSYNMDSTHEFESISIESDFPSYIKVNGSTFSGAFKDLFELPKNSLKYRIGLDYGEVSKFSELPPKGSAQIYSYTAPTAMIKNFNISVTIKYHDISTPENSLNITKHYIQPVQGDWNTFKQKLMDYVR